MEKHYRSPAERAAAIAHVQRLQEHGPRPAGPVVLASAGTAAPMDDGYDADEDLAGSASGARKFTMPNGRILWVHPIGPEQVLWINGQATRHVGRLALKPDDPMRPLAYRMVAWVYQVIACCRKGEAPDAPYVYTEKHAESLFRNPRPGHECIQRIVHLCDSLGNQQEESLSTELVDFFAGTASWLSILRSRWNTVSRESGLAALAAYERFVARITLRGKLSVSDLADFPPLPEPEAESRATRAHLRTRTIRRDRSRG